MAAGAYENRLFVFLPSLALSALHRRPPQFIEFIEHCQREWISRVHCVQVGEGDNRVSWYGYQALC